MLGIGICRTYSTFSCMHNPRLGTKDLLLRPFESHARVLVGPGAARLVYTITNATIGLSTCPPPLKLERPLPANREIRPQK